MTNNVLLRVMDNNILTRPNFKYQLKNLRIVLDFENIAYVLEVSFSINIVQDVVDKKHNTFDA